MKKIIFCLLLIFTAGIVFGQATVPAIVVSTFSTRGQTITADDAESITELFIAELAKQSGVRVVDRTSLERVIAEMRFQNSDYADPAHMKSLGQMTGADYLMTGSFDMLGNKLYHVVQMLDVETARIAFSSRMELNSWNEYDRKVRPFAEEFIAHFPLGEIFSGVWAATIEYNGSFDTYEIIFTGGSRCTVKISNGLVSQETAGTYSYDGTIFKLNALFRDAKIPYQNNIQWTAVLTFNENNTAFNINASPAANAGQQRFTFIKE